jgi:serine/threonine protein kinase
VGDGGEPHLPSFTGSLTGGPGTGTSSSSSSSSAVEAPELRSTERFRVVRRLGAGGMGVVYAAEDRERGGELVALKTIKSTDYETIYRLKREFRALAGLTHPNLVALHELFVDGDTCFFTMELLDGVDFLTYVRGAAAIGEAQTVNATPADLVAAARELGVQAGDLVTGATATGIACDEALLRRGLLQLAEGLHALHEAGKIHRDVKPSNICVTREGRVVLLDFGLVAEAANDHDARAGHVVGTVAYMAPEQAVGDVKVGPAADWYAVGVILYQALTGRVPFSGPTLQVIEDKQRLAPLPPRAIVPKVPRDLDELAVDLLSTAPRDRPGGLDVLRRLGGLVEETLPALTSQSRSGGRPFTGRERELGELYEAIAPFHAGRPAAVVVAGPSGIGKSTLVARFVDELRQDPDVVVLSGRCYERETVPWKAMDTLVDPLSSYWLSLPPADAREILPRDAAILPTLFPALGRVPAVVHAPRRAAAMGAEAADPQELRTRGFGALRELFQRLCDRRRLVLVLDDMQWVDANTMALLGDLMRPPDPPPLLLLLSGRDEGVASMEAALRRMDVERRVVQVRPLAAVDAHGLARRLLGDAADAELVDWVTREAAGSPFFLFELARYAAARAKAGDRPTLSSRGLEAVLADRIAQLSSAAGALLEIVALAGEPLGQKEAARAAGLTPEQMSRETRVLRAQRLLRAAARDEDAVEPYHDRVRETILAGLDDERRRQRHRALAVALSADASAERLARHWHGAGEDALAATYARLAGDEAAARLDFDRAAELYQMALSLGRFEPDKERALRTVLGETLVNAGRPADAARAFRRAADGADRAPGLELRRRAADAYLRGGYLDEGLAEIRGVLQAVGLGLAKTPMRGLWSLLWRRAWLRLRGLGFRVRAAAEIAFDELSRVDVCEAVATGLSMVDIIRSTEFGARYLSAALRVGEPRRLARALALEATFLAPQLQRARAERLVDTICRIGEQHDIGAMGRALERGARGFIAFFCKNDWRETVERFTEGEALMRAQHAAAGFELDTSQLFTCWALTYLGELDEVGRRVPALIQAAERRGNRYAAVTLRCGFQGVWLVRDDDITEAERDVLDALASWTPARAQYHIQHFVALYTRLDLLLYAGEHRRAAALFEEEMPLLRRAFFDRTPFNRALLEHQQARLALSELADPASPPSPSRRRHLLGVVRKLARRQLRDPQPLGRVFGLLTLAGLAAVEGDEARAVAELRRSVETLEAMSTNLYANAARRRLGMIVGGSEGEALVAQADAWMRKRGVRNTERMSTMLVAGWRHPG